jgi:methylthioribose-1-phosphate isomerase
VVWVTCSDAHEVARAIRDMVVRGAPAIGVAAAFGVALAARRGDDVRAAASELRSARPTAVNLAWAVDRMMRLVECGGHAAAVSPATESGRMAAALQIEAQKIFAEDVEANRRIGRFGAALLGESTTVLTHCNAGALATAGYGTALGVIRSAARQGKVKNVFADETRPYLQGARLTAWELSRDGIPTTLIADNMAGHLMSRAEVDAVIVGADRIAANGDVANKIGTYTLAVLAHENGLPFYVAAPVSTIDLATPSGDAIPIEERPPGEVTDHGGRRLAPAGIAVRNAAFDITPHRYVTAIICERGVARPPYDESLRALVGGRPS